LTLAGAGLRMAEPMRNRKRTVLPALVLAVTGLTLLGNQLRVFAYTSGTTGYDISYPQCGGAYPTGAFGIVGVNAGYPFKYYNPCLADEVAHTPNAALYINTGYDPSYTQVDGIHSTSDCVTQSVSVSGTPAQQAAWAVGCSEASRSIGYATSQGVTSPSSWWLDVETANSWSSTDLSLNQYTVQGIVDTLLRQSPAAVGIYSTRYQWNAIVGTLPVSGALADWVATGTNSARRAKRSCGTVGFSGVPVWFVQYLSGGFDTDYAC
jgi:hypothetical protein